ncbi:MAG TPA: cofactor-independent phosphoglycerate mutase [bacterium]|nr:cofactor-independent phosphoglycerate mutase [bacterium]HPQ65537.1 cofactor-independent phosphoglycerate mutase [bacterium]
MKTVVILGDGMADHPVAALEGKTALEAARIPNMDRLAREGAGGFLRTVPPGFSPGSDVANLSILGYNPASSYTGRGPLEAASLGVELQPDEVAFRCNLVTAAKDRLADYSAGHISSEEAGVIVDLLEARLGGRGIQFHAGVGYRQLAVVKEDLLEGGRGKLTTTPPHDIVGEPFHPHLPRGRGGGFLQDLIRKSLVILKNIEINEIRIDLGENPANMIWLWGEGKTPSIAHFEERFGLRGALISAVDLLNGIAVYAGLDRIAVPGATGYLDTDYGAKGAYAVRALEGFDVVFVHIEAPDEASHAGNVGEKIRAIEAIDEKVVGPLLAAAEAGGNVRILLLPDHLTPVEIKTHVEDPVPFAVWGPGIAPDAMASYGETEARRGRFGLRIGHKLLPLLLEREKL